MIEQKPEGDKFTLPTTEYLSKQFEMIRRWRGESLQVVEDVCGIDSSTLHRLEIGRTENLDAKHRFTLNKWLTINTKGVVPNGMKGALEAITNDPNLSVIDCLTLKEFLVNTYELILDRENFIRRMS